MQFFSEFQTADFSVAIMYCTLFFECTVKPLPPLLDQGKDDLIIIFVKLVIFRKVKPQVLFDSQLFSQPVLYLCR